LNVLNVENEDFGDEDFFTLNNFIDTKIPIGFGFLIRVCELGSDTDYCNMDNLSFIATMDKDIYVEEIVVSAEIGSGFDATYNPKKLRLFVWEGEGINMDCENECSSVGSVFSCSADSSQILTRTCGNIDSDFCLEWESNESELLETCGENEECVEELGVCVEIPTTFNLTCEKRVTSGGACGDINAPNCGGYDGVIDVGDCNCNWFKRNCDDWYVCYNDESITTECSENPVCPSGYNEVARNGCIPEVEECEDTCSPAGPVYSCSADSEKILVRTCGDFNDDGCLGWDDIKVYYACGTSKMCVAGSNVCVPKVAVLSASITIMSQYVSGDRNYYNYDLIIKETNGVGVDINRGRECFQLKGCASWVSFSPARRVPANGQYDRSSYWWTSYPYEEYWLEYEGLDDNGNFISVATNKLIHSS